MYSRIETITPQIAENYLTHNANNRKLRAHTIRNYARDMKNGDWELNPDGIAFYENGDLANGQHRLHGVIEAGVPVVMYVTYDVPNDSKIFDRGKVRTEADILHFSGFGGSVANNYSAAIVNALFANVSKKPTIGMLTEFMDMYGDIVCTAARLTQRGCSSDKSICRKAPVGAAVFCALYCGIDEEGLSEFFSIANTGFDGSDDKSSAIVLRNYIMQDYSGRNTKDRNDLFKISAYAIRDFCNGIPRKRRCKLDQSLPFWPYTKKQIIDPYIKSY